MARPRLGYLRGKIQDPDAASLSSAWNPATFAAVCIQLTTTLAPLGSEEARSFPRARGVDLVLIFVERGCRS
jgi:hypothetical protein